MGACCVHPMKGKDHPIGRKAQNLGDVHPLKESVHSQREIVNLDLENNNVCVEYTQAL